MNNLENKIYTFENFLEDIKKKSNKALKALCENYNVNNDELFTLNEIADLYDDWDFHLRYGFPTQYNYEKCLYEFLNKTCDINLFFEKMKEIPSCVQYDETSYAGIFAVFFATDEAISLDKDNIILHPDDENAIKHACISLGYCENTRYLEKTKSQKDLIVIEFRANYTEEVTNEVYNLEHPKFHPENAVLYHMCPKIIWENKIKKTGLIPKSKKKHKRNYEPRIYFFYTYNKNKAQVYAQSLYNGIEDKEKENEYYNDTLKDWVVLKINLKRANEQYRFFMDPEYFFPYEACFTYETIHPRCISKIADIQV